MAAAMAALRAAVALLSAVGAVRLERRALDFEGGAPNATEQLATVDEHGPRPSPKSLEHKPPHPSKKAQQHKPRPSPSVMMRNMRTSALAGAKTQALRRLNRAAARGPRPVFYFLGDSLMRQEYQSFCELANGTYPRKGVPMQAGLHTEGKTHHCECRLAYAVYMVAVDFHRGAVQQLLDQGHPAPTVVFMLSGYHLLHLHPALEMTKWRFERLVMYEKHLRATLEAYRRTVPHVGLTLMTPYSICEDKYYGDYASVVKVVHRNATEAARPCAAAMEKDPVIGANFNRTVIEGLCAHSFLTREGSGLVAYMVRNVVASSASLRGGPASLVDSFMMSDGHCDVGGPDGRHFTTFVHKELDMMLASNGF